MIIEPAASFIGLYKHTHIIFIYAIYAHLIGIHTLSEIQIVNICFSIYIIPCVGEPTHGSSLQF